MASKFLFLLLSLLLLPLLLLLKFKFTRSQNKYRLPPGPWTLPTIGSIHHLVGRGLPHRAFRSLSRRYGHLMFLQLGEQQTVIVSSKEAAREVMKTHDLSFCTRYVNASTAYLTYGQKDVAFAPYGEYWREMRKICVLELLSAKRVQSFRPIREEEVNILIQQIQSLSASKQSVDLSARFITLTNDVTLRAIMGRKTKYHDMYLRENQNYIKLVGEVGLASFFPSSRLLRMITGAEHRAEDIRCKLDQIFENILREQKENEVNEDAENLLRVLLRLHDEDSEKRVLTLDSIKAVINDVIGGGTETSASILEWAMAELMKNPRVMIKVQTEIRQRLRGRNNITESDLGDLHYMHLVIKETLRLHPVPVVPRECRDTCNILGYDIPKGSIVIVNTWALGRDPYYWEDAEEFKPERFAEANNNMHFNGGDFEFIPFGAGRRICPGISFASSMIELVLANLLYHFNWELPEGVTPDEFDMTEIADLVGSRKFPLCLRPLPYKC